jgi:hypothetical protein
MDDRRPQVGQSPSDGVRPIGKGAFLRRQRKPCRFESRDRCRCALDVHFQAVIARQLRQTARDPLGPTEAGTRQYMYDSSQRHFSGYLAQAPSQGSSRCQSSGVENPALDCNTAKYGGPSPSNRDEGSHPSRLFVFFHKERSMS